MKNFHSKIRAIDDDALQFILEKTKNKTFEFKADETGETGLLLDIYSHHSGEIVPIDVFRIDNKGITGYSRELGEEIYVPYCNREQFLDGDFAWIADLMDDTKEDDKQKKHNLVVIFGSQAVDYADEKGVEKTIKAIKRGTIEGSYSVYELDTKADVEVVKRALDDADGWEGCFWSETEVLCEQK